MQLLQLAFALLGQGLSFWSLAPLKVRKPFCACVLCLLSFFCSSKSPSSRQKLDGRQAASPSAPCFAKKTAAAQMPVTQSSKLKASCLLLTWQCPLKLVHPGGAPLRPHNTTRHAWVNGGEALFRLLVLPPARRRLHSLEIAMIT